MASFLETLMALNRAGMPMGELPPMPAPARPMQIMPSGPLFAPPPNPMPGLPPIVAPPPLDQGLIAQYAGQQPIAQQPSFLDKLATVLQGISAGAQGQGPQYAQSIKEQRERPQREYQARKLAGVEAAQRKQEREQAQLQRQAEEQSQREFQIFMGNRTFTNQIARDQAQRAFQLEMATRKAQAQAEEQAKKDKEAQEREIRAQADKLRDDFKAVKRPLSVAQSLRLAKNLVVGTPLSKEDQRVYNQTPVQGTGKAEGEKVNRMIQRFNNLKDQLVKAMPIYKPGTSEIVSYGDQKLETNLRNRIVNLGLKLQDKGNEVGLGDYPYVKPRGQAAPAATPQGTLTNQQRAKFNDIKRELPDKSDDQIYAYMRKKGWL